MSEVVFKNVCKNYGQVTVIHDLNLTIRDGEFLVLVGPSGCGKSTILRMIAGLEKITAGELYIGDRLVNDLPPKDRDIAMVFQNYALYPHMNVYENMAFGLKLRRFPGEEIDRRVKEAASILRIEHLLKRKPKELSGGQRQRVAIGRSIVRKPQVFLMDEPLSNLDAKLRVEMRAEISKLHNRLQTTVVYVTHDQTEAMTMGERIAVIKDGSIQQVDTPLNIYNHPANMFVAGFIGSPAMNFLPCRVERIDDEFYLDAQAFKIQVPKAKTEKLEAYTGREVVFGFRPEDIHSEPVLSETHANSSFTGVVDVVELLGAEMIVHLSTGTHSIIAKLDVRTRLKRGDKLQLTFDMNKIHLFDKENEVAIL